MTECSLSALPTIHSEARWGLEARDGGQRVRRKVLVLQKAHRFGLAQSVKQPMRVEPFVYGDLFGSFWRQRTENVGRECEGG